MIQIPLTWADTIILSTLSSSMLWWCLTSGIISVLDCLGSKHLRNNVIKSWFLIPLSSLTGFSGNRSSFSHATYKSEIKTSNHYLYSADGNHCETKCSWGEVWWTRENLREVREEIWGKSERNSSQSADCYHISLGLSAIPNLLWKHLETACRL